MESFNAIFKNLCDKLKCEGTLEETSQYFGSLKSDYERFKFSLELLENYGVFPEFVSACYKNAALSTKYRNEGNNDFLKRRDLEALEQYSKSVAFAPTDSEELFLAFANRSAVSFSLKRYDDCITDIDRALSGNYPDRLKYKLYERKGKCCLYLGKSKYAKESFKNALSSINKAKLTEDKTNSIVHALNEELKNLVADQSYLGIVEKSVCEPEMPTLSYPPSEEILAACDAVRIDYDKEFGRHIVAAKTIHPGDVLVIEQPYSSVLLPSCYNLYCFFCLRRCHTLLPCCRCTKVLFCSIDCRDKCYKTSHRIECAVLTDLIRLGCSKMELLAIRMLIKASNCGDVKSLKQVVKSIRQRNSNSNMEDECRKGFSEKGKYRSDDYRAAHELATNSESRTNADLFRRSCFAVCIIRCFDMLSDYFKTETDCKCNIDTVVICDDYSEYVDNRLFCGSLLLRYLQIMPCNAHEVSEMCVTKKSESDDNESFVYDSKEIGGALYPVLSLINHSCDPNVVRHSHNGDTVVLTAIRRVQQGEQVLDNYGYHHAVHDVLTRRSHLFSQYHFVCNCVACVEDWPRYNLLPDKQIMYKMPLLKEQVEKSSKEFRLLLQQVLKGNLNTSDNTLGKLTKYLSLLEDAVKRPWKEFSECQEAIKQILSMYANHFVMVS